MPAKKKAAVKASGRTKAAKKKSGKNRERKKRVTPRQVKLIQGLAQGKSTYRAALDAGYAHNTAKDASDLLSTEAMRAFVRRRLSLDKICQRIDEGMDATHKESIVIGSKLRGDEQVVVNEFVDYGERRQASALAAKLVGADPSIKIDLTGDVTQRVIIEMTDVAQESA